jgi:hypothetical protein
MARFDGRILVVALQALLLGCGRESRQPEPATIAPAPAVQPQAAPPEAEPPASPKSPKPKSPKDRTETESYPWQSGPIAAL